MTSSVTPPDHGLGHQILTRPTRPSAGAGQSRVDAPPGHPSGADESTPPRGLALGRNHREIERDPALPDALVTGLEHALRLMAIQAYAKVSVMVGERSGGTQPPTAETTPPPAGEGTAPTGTPPSAGTPPDGGVTTGGGDGQSVSLETTVAAALGFSTTAALQSALQAEVTVGSASSTLEASNAQVVVALGSDWQWSHQRATMLASGTMQVDQDYAKSDSAGQQTTVSLSQVLDSAGQTTSASARVYTDLTGGKGITATFAENPDGAVSGTLTVQLYNFQTQTSQFTATGDATTALASLTDILAAQGISGSATDAIVTSFTEALRAAGIDLP